MVEVSTAHCCKLCCEAENTTLQCRSINFTNELQRVAEVAEVHNGNLCSDLLDNLLQGL